jgi:hypothetical protein
MSDVTRRLQAWFANQCDDNWEHDRGVRIDTLDNPGWHVRIDVTGTPLEERLFVSVDTERKEGDWLRCNVKNGVFEGFGGAENLTEILESFLRWANV